MRGCRRKERLWPHIREFADNGIAHTKRMLSALGENGTPCELYAIHGHYADAGEARFLLHPPCYGRADNLGLLCPPTRSVALGGEGTPSHSHYSNAGEARIHYRGFYLKDYTQPC